MMQGWRRTRAGCVALAAAWGMAAGSLEAQSSAPKGSSRATARATATGGLPRTSNGRPDLQGVWNFGSATPLERPEAFAGKGVLSSDEAGAYEKQVVAGRDSDQNRVPGTENDVSRGYNNIWWDWGKTLAGNRTSLIVDPPDGRLPPHTPAGRERFTSYGGFSGRNGTDSWEDRSLWERCLSYGGLPRMPGGYNNTLQIFQTSDYVAIHYEMVHEVRLIPLDGRPHLGSTLRQVLGDSRGRWEGDSLVVDVANFTDKTNFRGSASGLHLVERFTRVDANTLSYEFRVDDPTTFTAPWTASFPFARIDEKVYEYACHEGNTGMVGILAGARRKEGAPVVGAR